MLKKEEEMLSAVKERQMQVLLETFDFENGMDCCVKLYILGDLLRLSH